ncbi:hypothetical protein ACPCSP_25560 [Streptomyces cinereoruber]|uniref:hypothetical protein n=1 Tax=Streptomyces cinereoruber TaxID=67260 RepID=UPI003C2BA29D
MRDEMTETRVSLDGILGPYDCKLDLHHRWNGWMSPHFTLDTVRELSAETIATANDYGWRETDTIHVIEGRADSPDTVHVIDTGLTYEINEDGDTAPLAITVRIPWRKLDRGGKATIGKLTPDARKAARRSKPGGRGAARAVVVHARWMYFEETGQGADIVEPDTEGLFPVGGFEWCWSIHHWWCVCGADRRWHETECLCGQTRDNQPPLAEGAVQEVARLLRTLVPKATSALVDFGSGLARVTDVFAGDTEVDMADDTGPFDTETLGEADEVLRKAVDRADCLNDLVADWERIPHKRTPHLYRIAFPAVGQ